MTVKSFEFAALTHFPESRIAEVKLSEFPKYIVVSYPVPCFSPLSKCKGFTSISEDSSEISFLLVENYNYDRSLWSSDRMGIFGQIIDLSLARFVSFHC